MPGPTIAYMLKQVLVPVYFGEVGFHVFFYFSECSTYRQVFE